MQILKFKLGHCFRECENYLDWWLVVIGIDDDEKRIKKIRYLEWLCIFMVKDKKT